MQLGDWRVKITLAFAAMCAVFMVLALGATMHNRNEAAERLMVASIACAVLGCVALFVFLIGSYLYWRKFDGSKKD